MIIISGTRVGHTAEASATSAVTVKGWSLISINHPGVRDVQDFLKDNNWHLAYEVRHILTKYKIGFDAVSRLINIAEDDTGSFVCIPDTHTSLLSPGEIELNDEKLFKILLTRIHNFRKK